MAAPATRPTASRPGSTALGLPEPALLAIVYADQVRDDIARGELVPVLEDYSTPFPGYYLYFPRRRHASPALRALIEYLRQARKQPQAIGGTSLNRIGQSLR